MEKDFQWQYSDEKLLFKNHEHIFSFLMDKTHLWVVSLVVSWVIAGIIGYLTLSIFIWIITFILTLLIYVGYLIILFKNTWLIITPRRIIKLTQNGLFKKRRRELKLLDIKATDAKRWVIGTFLWYSELTIKWTESDASIYFKGIKGGQDIANYIGRVIDYIKLNGHGDEIARYVPKKVRRK